MTVAPIQRIVIRKQRHPRFGGRWMVRFYPRWDGKHWFGFTYATHAEALEAVASTLRNRASPTTGLAIDPRYPLA